MMMRGRHRAIGFTAVLLGIVLFAGCEEEEPPADFVARVGDRYLLREEVDRALTSLPVAQDSAEARQQIIEQWVTGELLYQEAQRLGLRQRPDVQRLLQESERTVLVNALVSHLYEENSQAPTPSEKQSYFESHKEQLRLRESFARVRYLVADDPQDAAAARRMLQQAPTEERDSVWQIAIAERASNPALSAEISSTYYPESRIFINEPVLQEAFTGLLGGQLAPIIEADSLYHVLQLVERIPSRSIPEPEWIDDELERRLIIQARKQLYARQVQRLRNEAFAREDLEIR